MASFSLPFLISILTVSALSSGAAPGETTPAPATVNVPLTVPAGVPLRLALEKRLRIKHLNVAASGFRVDAPPQRSTFTRTSTRRSGLLWLRVLQRYRTPAMLRRQAGHGPKRDF